jgi:hypothetical protein
MILLAVLICSSAKTNSSLFIRVGGL